MRHRRLLLLSILLLAAVLFLGMRPFQFASVSVQTTSTPAAGSGVTSFFTTDLAPVRPFQNNGRFYTTWTTTNSPATAGSVSGELAYCNDFKNPYQGLLAYLDRPAGVAHLDVITAYNTTTGATTRTSLISTAFTFVSGAQLLLVVDMTNPAAPFGQLFYNNAQVGTGRTDLTAYASWLTTNRRHAIFSTTAVTPGSVTYDYNSITYQTDLVQAGLGDFTSGVTTGWAKFGNNVVDVDSGAMRVTYVDNGGGAEAALTAANYLTTNLTTGNLYCLTAQSKVSAGASANLRVDIWSFYTGIPEAWTTINLYFVFSGAATYIYFGALGAGEIVYLDDVRIRRVQ